MSKIIIFWYLFMGFMFIGSKYWGDAQDTIFWGILLLMTQATANHIEEKL